MARAFQIYVSTDFSEIGVEALERIAQQGREDGERVTAYTFDIEGEDDYGEAVFLEHAGRVAISWNDEIIWIENAVSAQDGVRSWLEKGGTPG